ncbi:MAG: tRNA pseudouridine(13) synthase TruD [Xanthomonadales bacterium]|nr:tRNA pseudouridine(13) synthase TruD [Xanthomonadales bacterium]
MSVDFDALFPTFNQISARGQIKCKDADFIVTEHTDIDFTGDGEHLWLYVEKINSNTDWVAKQLSNICQVPRMQVGFAGLKDRHAITRQWFSVQLPKVSDISKINSALPDEIQIINSSWHNRKLKTGQLDYNHFEILIRNIEGDKNSVDENIENIKRFGFPNYFGPQRFGIEMGNIEKAKDWFSGTYKVKNKNLKSLLISTARSYIFNSIVAERIKQGIWNKSVKGDIFQLQGSNSWFKDSDATPDEISTRLKDFDINITAAMWGENQSISNDECLVLEENIASQFQTFQQGLTKFRLKQERRSIRCIASELSHEWFDKNLKLSFSLQPGSYATGLIREILNYSE